MKNKLSLLLILFHLFMFAQKNYIDKRINLSANIKKNEIRIYISPCFCYNSDVLVLNKYKSGNIKAKYYKNICEKCKITRKIYEIKNDSEFWNNLMDTDIININDNLNKILPNNKSFYLDAGSVTVFISDGKQVKQINFEEPYDYYRDYPYVKEFKNFIHFIELLNDKFKINLYK